MAEINLLKQNSGSQNYAKSLLRVVGILLIVAVIGMVGYYIWITVSINRINSQATSLTASLAASKTSALHSPDRGELLTRQAQLSQLEKLTGTHVYWSDILPALAKVTLKDAHFISFKAANDGSLAVSVVVPNMSEFDKFLQVFDQSQFNSNFYNLKVSGVGNFQDKGVSYTTFEVSMNYSPALLQAPKP